MSHEFRKVGRRICRLATNALRFVVPAPGTWREIRSRSARHLTMRHLTAWHRIAWHLIVFPAIVLTWSAGRCLAQQPSGTSGPSSPQTTEQALRLFQLDDDRLEVQLVAAEPLVQDPVAAHFAADGGLWVVEMGDYPAGPREGEPPGSRIKILRDTDRDGRYDTATVFADQLLFATELQPWQAGVIATIAGEIVYLADTNGDDRADVRETWYQGFAQENSQLRANHPRLGLDGWIHVSNGLRGGAVRDARVTDAPAVPLAGKDFRFHPRTGAYEATTGVGQFGLTFDDFGNRFICSNRNPLMHVVLEERYLQRNSHYAPAAARFDSGRAGEESRVYPISRAWTTSNLHAGQFTAACGVLIFRGAGLPDPYYGNGFTCDPTGNLVHRESLSPLGATFRGVTSEKPMEFLASPDEWFRPVNLANGPGGGLYVVDMYRAVIEHPDFMPEELKRRPDLLLGKELGRIWRIVDKSAGPIHVPLLSAETSSQLVARLDAPGWEGDTAFRLLYERHDRSVTGELAAAAGQMPATGATRALWLLQHFDSLSDDTLRVAFRSPLGRVREQAVQLAEMRGDDSQWREPVVRLADDPDTRVRFQVALSLAPIRTAEETGALLRIVRAAPEDEWTRRAVAISAGTRAGELAVSLVPLMGQSPATANDLLAMAGELFGIVAAQRQPDALHKVLSVIAQRDKADDAPQFQQELLLAFASSLGRGGLDLMTVAGKLEPSDRAALDRQMEQTRARLTADAELSQRVAAVQLLGYDERYAPDLMAIVLSDSTAESPVELRTQALTALARQPRLDLLRKLLMGWSRESPAFRRRLLDVLLARPDRTELLLASLESGEVRPSELESSVSNRLLKHGQAAIRQRAEQVLASLIPADRQQVLSSYQTVLQMPSDPVRGRSVFHKNCSTCHRIGDLGVNVAPDISDSRVKRAEQLLTDILQPNRAIDNNYLSYSVVTADGLTATGVIVGETGNSITLRQQEGKETTFLRSTVEELRSNGVSLMPDGLEKNIPPQEMADLIAFIKNWRYLDGRTPLMP